MNTVEMLRVVNDTMQSISSGCTDEAAKRLEEARKALEEQVRAEAAKSAGRGNAQKVIAAMLKSMKNDARPILQYAFIDKQGRQCALDGFRAFRLKKHLPLEMVPEEMKSQTIDLDRVFYPEHTLFKELQLPTAAEVKAHMDSERAKWQGKPKDFSAKYDFGAHGPVVNAKYLLDAVTVFPSCRVAYWTTPVSPIYLTCDDGDGLMLPIRDNGHVYTPATERDEAIDIYYGNRDKEFNPREFEFLAEHIA